MAGSKSATIEAWSIPIQPAPFADHTYVTSSCGYRWGCFGRDAGGSVVVPGGIGDSNIAECLSHPRAGSYEFAGLTYLVHGVCHQATNRVLDPTNFTLSGAVRGYWISTLRFGTYGLNPWTRRVLCYNTGKKPRTAVPPRSGFASGLETVDTAPNSSGAMRMPGIPDSALLDMFGSSPELSVNTETIERLSVVVRNSIRAQEALARQFDNKQIGPADFQRRAQDEHRRVLTTIKEIIGPSRFYQIFGQIADFPEFVADPEPFFKEFGP